MWLLVVFVFVLPLLALAMSGYVLLRFRRIVGKLSAVALMSGKESSDER